MMLAAGIGPAGYAFAIFHLLTHGFFKANMFLGAGSVMHGMDDDVEHAALRRAVDVPCRSPSAPSPPATWRSSASRSSSGYYSKDHIIEAAFEHSALVGVLAMLGAGVTAFYMTRLMLMTFLGEKRWLRGRAPARVARGDDRSADHPRRASSLSGGLVLNNWIGGWLDPAVRWRPRAGERRACCTSPRSAGSRLLVVAVGVAIGFVLVFGPRKDDPDDRAAEPVRRSPSPAATTCTATRSTRRC